MVKPKDKAAYQKKIRTPGGRNKLVILKAKKGKPHCNDCGNKLQGVADDTRKYSKTERRPSAIFAGKLCNTCRTHAVEEALKVKTNVKKRDQVNLSTQRYVAEILEQVDKRDQVLK
jgi:ribosomal protein L34E